MLSTAGSSPFSNTRRPTLAQPPPRTYYNPATWHPAAIPIRRPIVPHHSRATSNGCRQEQGWIEEFTRTHRASQPLSKRHPLTGYPALPRINPHHTYHPASMPSGRASHDESGNVGNITGAEEVAVGATGGKQGKPAGRGKGTQADEALDKGGLGAIAGAEEVKAKL